MLNFRHSAFEMHFYFRNVINRKIQADLINFPPRLRSLFCLQSLETPAQSSPWPCECCLSAVEVKQDLLRQIKQREKLGK